MANLTSSLIMTLVDNVTGPAKSVADALKNTETQFKNIDKALAGTNASTKFREQLASLGRSSADIDRVANAWKEYASAARQAEGASSWTKTQAGQMKSWEAQMIRSLKEVGKAEQQFQQGQNAAARVPGRFSRAAGHVGSTAAMVAGPGILHGAYDAVKAGAEVESAKTKMRAAGISEEEIKRVQEESADISTRVKGSKIHETMETFKDLRSVLLHPEEAHELLETTAKTRAAMNAVDKTGHMAEGLPYAIKGAEVLGLAQDPKRYEAYMDSFVKAQQVVGKTITPEQQYEFAKYAKASGVTLSDRFKMTTGVSLSQELGGSTTGQSIDQFVKQVVGGFQGQQHSAAKEFVDLGLANKEDFETTKTGEIKGMKPGRHVKGWKLAQTDPDRYVNEYIVPAMEAQGITSQEDQIAKVRRLFPAGRSADVVSKMITQRESFANHAKLYEQAQGLNAVSQNQTDPFVAMKSFSAAVENISGQLTAAPVAQFTEALNSATGAISGWAKSLSSWAEEHPTQAKIAGGAAIGGTVAAGGALTYGLIQALTGGGKQLAISAGLLDGAATALTGAATALTGAAGVKGVAGAAGNAAGAAAGAGGVAAGAARKAGGFLSRVGRGAATGGIAGAVIEGAEPFYEHVSDANNPGAGESRAARGATIRNAYRSQFAQDRQRLGIDTGGFVPPGWTLNAGANPVGAGGGGPPGDQSAFEGGGSAVPHIEGTQQAMQQLSSSAGAAGAQAGQGFDIGLVGALEGTVAKVQSIMEQIRGLLQFDASPNVTPGGNSSGAGAGAGDKQSSNMPAYDHRYASHGDGATHFSA